MRDKNNEDLLNSRRAAMDLSKQKHEERQKMNEEIARSRYNDVKRIKQESHNNDIKKQQILNAYVEKNHQKKMDVRSNEMRTIQKKNEFQEKKIKESKQNYDMRIQEELSKIKTREKLLTTMEKEEGELIKKLQNSQEMQKKAYTDKCLILSSV